MSQSIKVRVRITHNLFAEEGDLVLGPDANKGDILEVVGITTRKYAGKTDKHFIVLVDSKRYIAWPPHCERT